MGIEVKGIDRVGAIALLLLCATSAFASSMVEDEWTDVGMATDRGDRVVATSDGTRLVTFEFCVNGTTRRVDASFAHELEGPLINETRVLIDSVDDKGFSPRHVLIPFREWRGSTHQRVSLMLTFGASGMTRAAVVANDDLDKPIHVFRQDADTRRQR